MNVTELEKLSVEEMNQIKGGEKQLVWIDGQWVWIETYDLGDEDYENI